MTVQYGVMSPYYKATQTSNYLDYFEPGTIYPADSDESYTIPLEYAEQPWRASYDLYGNERLYYIFAVINYDLIQDPIYDFKAGLVIQVPTLERVKSFLQ
jgi:hypothetical protein